MNRKVSVFLTLLLCWLLQSNFIYAQDNFIEVISNKSIKFSKEGQEKLARVKNQKLYQEPQIVQFRDIEKVIKEKALNLYYLITRVNYLLNTKVESMKIAIITIGMELFTTKNKKTVTMVVFCL